MKPKSTGTLTFAVSLAALTWGCSGADTDQAPLGSAGLELGSWLGSNFTQVLRVNQAETTVRNRCELTIPLSSAKPLSFIKIVNGSTTPVGWNGSAVSVPGFSVSGCASYPCDVVATATGTGGNGVTLGCEIIADDGTTRVSGTSSGTALAVHALPTAPVIYNQSVTAQPAGISEACILRQSDQITAAQVSGFQVVLNGVGVVNLPGSTNIGNVTWPTKLQSIPFGSVYVGSELGATRLKHTAPATQVGEGDALMCFGLFSDGIAPVFDINMSGAPSGNGMSLQTAATGWTCASSKFGTGDGCDCDCGVIDPDCGAHDCTHIAVTNQLAQNFVFDGVFAATLNLTKGRTYVFDVNTPNHPFAIHSVPMNTSTSVRYNDGVTGQGVMVGQLKFTPSAAAPAQVYYQCEVHAMMTGTINLLGAAL